jgi:hypothetical protein
MTAAPTPPSSHALEETPRAEPRERAPRRRSGPRSLLSRVVAGAVWTVALAGLLVALDRLLLGPAAATGWVELGRVEALPEPARPTVVPTYLPNAVMWPPARVLYLAAGDTGSWWLGLVAPSGGDPRVWIGNRADGAAGAAGAIGLAAGCLLETRPLCPPGWHVLSTEVRPGLAVVVVADLPPLQLRRILDGLRVDR